MIINPKVGIRIPFKLAVVMASKGTRKGSGTKAHIKSKTPKIKKTKIKDLSKIKCFNCN